MIRPAMFLGVLALSLGVVGASADVYDFSYVGISDPSIYGSGTFTTGTPYGDGYLPIISITGTTEAGMITGLETSGGTGVDPNLGSLTCCAVGPPTLMGLPDFFYYDNAFMSSDPANPFSSNGLLIDVPMGNGTDGYSLSPINIYGDGNGHTYELSYGEDSPSPAGPVFGGTPISFHATLTPEPTFYGAVALCMGGLLLARWRRHRS